jgi:hypothetical protein
MKMNRMFSMLNSRGCLVIVIVCMAGALAAAIESIPVQWLDGHAPPITTGISWGVPWSKGTVQPDHAFTLAAVSGQSLPVQTWPLAYWPDGSLKWSGFATVADSNSTGLLQLTPSQGEVRLSRGLRVIKSDTTVLIDTGVLRTRIRMWGGSLIDTIIERFWRDMSFGCGLLPPLRCGEA